MKIQLKVNGQSKALMCRRMPLCGHCATRWISRAKVGCGIAQAGRARCTSTGVATRSCATRRPEQGRTQASKAVAEGTHALQQAWRSSTSQAAIAGRQIMAAGGLLRDASHYPESTRDGANICRWTLYRIRRRSTAPPRSRAEPARRCAEREPDGTKQGGTGNDAPPSLAARLSFAQQHCGGGLLSPAITRSRRREAAAGLAKGSLADPDQRVLAITPDGIVTIMRRPEVGQGSRRCCPSDRQEPTWGKNVRVDSAVRPTSSRAKLPRQHGTPRTTCRCARGLGGRAM